MILINFYFRKIIIKRQIELYYKNSPIPIFSLLVSENDFRMFYPLRQEFKIDSPYTVVTLDSPATQMLSKSDSCRHTLRTTKKESTVIVRA